MSQFKYILELLVTEVGSKFYPALGTIEYPNIGNAGYDLKIVTPQEARQLATLAPLGVKARMQRIVPDSDPVDCHFTLEPRSSIYKTGFMMANGRGIIDMTYRGELMAPLITVSPLSSCPTLDAGTRLFQIIAPDMGHISEVRYVSDLPTTVRGTNGFGSTGTK
jgi:dUTP pyrophosphatase